MSWDPGKNWSYAQISLLWELSKEGKTLRELAARIGKSEDAVLEKAEALGITLEYTGAIQVIKEKGA